MKVKLLFLFLIFGLVSVFFKDSILKGNLPIPADTIVGLYYPYKDFYAKDYSRGVPFKNYLITDPVRQQYPWKNLAINLEKKLNLPLWNPYSFSGTPLLANFQSAVFYPLNILFLFLPFSVSWSLLIFSQPLLAGLFLFLYLDNLKLDKRASLLASLTFAFCGFSVAWMEWGNIISTALWLPLLLLSIDKILDNFENKKTVLWSIIYFIALLFSFSAGHLQSFFYLSLISISYFIFRSFTTKNFKIGLLVATFIYGIFGFISSIIWIPLVQFIILSARSLDQANWTQAGWFIPWQNLIQFIVPDFFGNPSTLNYFGVFNYGEFIGYIGIFSLILALYVILFKRNKNTMFFAFVLLISFVFALPNFISKIPYEFSIPFISTSQPTRLMFPITFSLAVLAGFGLDYFLTAINKKNILVILFLLFIGFIAIWIFVLSSGFNLINITNIAVSKRNLMFPSLLFVITSLILTILVFIPKHYKNSKKIFDYSVYLLILILVLDLFRFGWKYISFTTSNYLYPTTKVLSFLQKNTGNFRIMETSSEILPPNFSIIYKLQSVDGYDPLYLQRYAELIAALEREKPDISPPFGFNRIITPKNFKSDLVNLLGVKYILSTTDINDPAFKKVLQEGSTRVYENASVIDRAFFVEKTIAAKSKQEEINAIYSNNPLRHRAVVSTMDSSFSRTWSVGKASVVNYAQNKVSINTSNKAEGFLILTDSFYPTWKAKIDGNQTQIYLTDYNFRGIIIPKGEHKIIFYDTLF